MTTQGRMGLFGTHWPPGTARPAVNKEAVKPSLKPIAGDRTNAATTTTVSFKTTMAAPRNSPPLYYKSQMWTQDYPWRPPPADRMQGKLPNTRRSRQNKITPSPQPRPQETKSYTQIAHTFCTLINTNSTQLSRQCPTTGNIPSTSVQSKQLSCKPSTHLAG